MINSVLSGLSLSILDDIPFLNIQKTRIQFVKSQGCIFVRDMNKQLRVVCIKVVFDVRMRSNNLTQRSGV